MAKKLWNVKQNCEVPYNPKMNVEVNKDLEWRDDSQQGVAETAENVPAPKSAPKVSKRKATAKR